MMPSLRYVGRCYWTDGSNEWIDSRWADLADADKRAKEVTAWNAYHGKDLRVKIEDEGTV